MPKRNQALEAQIARDLDAAPAFLVYADWLQAEGDPRGELVMLQHALATAPDDTRKAREAELLALPDHLGDVDPELATFGWRWGFVDRVSILNERDWMDSSYDVLPLVRRIFEAPVAAFVRELRLGVIRWMENAEDVPRVLEEVGRLGGARHVRRLVLGDMKDNDCDLAHHPIGPIDAITTYFHDLEVLSLWGTEMDLSSPLALPRLKELTVETCALERQTGAAIVNGALPALERLTLWFGSRNYGGDCTAADLTRLLDGKAFPKLKHLGLMNAEFSDDLCAALAQAPIVDQLESLDLSLGTMSDAGARSLLDARERFAHLARFDVSDNFLTDESAALADFAITVPQKTAYEHDGATHRYVTHAE